MAASAKTTRRGGRQSLYQDEHHPRLARWMIAKGASLSEVAGMIGVTKKTLDNWRKRFPEFDEACDEPQGQAVQRVEASLYQRSLGYDRRTLKVVQEKDGEGNLVEVRREESARHVPPDPVSMQFFLTNRASADWKAKSSIEHSVDDDLGARLDRAFAQAGERPNDDS